jgi:hypothetical protein
MAWTVNLFDCYRQPRSEMSNEKPQSQTLNLEMPPNIYIVVILPITHHAITVINRSL